MRHAFSIAPLLVSLAAVRLASAQGRKMTVLVVPRNFEPTFSEIWERDPANEDDVDFVTDDLAAFLTAIVDVVA
jgi:hypothetical protein